MRLVHWLYILLLTAPAIGRLVQKLSNDTGGLASRYAPLLVSLLLIVGFIGYVRKKPFLCRGFWRFCFWLLAVSSALLFVYALFLLASVGAAVALETALMMSGLAVITPALLAIHRYSDASNAVWSRAQR